MVNLSISIPYELLQKVQNKIKQLKKEKIEEYLKLGKNKEEAVKLADKEFTVSGFIRRLTEDFFHDEEVDENEDDENDKSEEN